MEKIEHCAQFDCQIYREIFGSRKPTVRPMFEQWSGEPFALLLKNNSFVKSIFKNLRNAYAEPRKAGAQYEADEYGG